METARKWTWCRHDSTMLARDVTLAALSAVALLALYQRLPGFNPESLWLDDLWVAALTKVSTLSTISQAPIPVPPAFLYLLELAAHLGGDPETSLQLIPFAAGLVQIPLFYLLVERVTSSRFAGLAAALLLGLNPALAQYSLRVKPYSMESLATIVILLGVIACINQSSTRRFFLLCGTALVLTLFSIPLVLLALPAIHIVAVASMLREKRANHRYAMMAALLLFDLAVGALYLLLSARQANPALKSYWRDHFMTDWSPGSLLEFMATRGVDVIDNALPVATDWMAWLVLPGVIALLLRRPLTGLVAISGIGCFLIASALALYPLGAARTDIFAVPLIILIILGIPCLLPAWRERIGAGMLVLILSSSVLNSDSSLLHQRYEYPEADDAKLVYELGSRITPEDALLISPHANWGVAYYADWEVSLRRVGYYGTNFEMRIKRPRTLVLPGGVNGTPYRRDPRILAPMISEFLAGAHRRIYFIATHADPGTVSQLESFIESGGYHKRGLVDGDGPGSLAVFVRASGEPVHPSGRQTLKPGGER